MKKGFNFDEARANDSSNRHEDWADRSLEMSKRELRQLRNVMTKYKDDPEGRKKMLKKMKKFYNSSIAEIERIDYKPQ